MGRISELQVREYNLWELKKSKKYLGIKDVDAYVKEFGSVDIA